jgi:integrase
MDPAGASRCRLSLEGLDEIISGARARAGLAHGTCHEPRHTCLTRLRQAGMSIEALQAQAGHRSIASTQLYLIPQELHQTRGRVLVAY